ncbi:MAG: hypothetical protein IPK74_39885 [Deltaproteobacteria bacterium]|nr:hypothetical protein [Deltaproteobacteria bacterium]
MTTLDQAFAALKAAEVAAEKSNQLFNELLKLTREVAVVKERANEEASRLAFIVEISDDVAAAAAAADKAQEAALSVKTAFDATNFATKIAKIAAAEADLVAAKAALTVAELEKFS